MWYGEGRPHRYGGSENGSTAGAEVRAFWYSAFIMGDTCDGGCRCLCFEMQR